MLVTANDSCNALISHTTNDVLNPKRSRGSCKQKCGECSFVDDVMFTLRRQVQYECKPLQALFLPMQSIFIYMLCRCLSGLGDMRMAS